MVTNKIDMLNNGTELLACGACAQEMKDPAVAVPKRVLFPAEKHCIAERAQRESVAEFLLNAMGAGNASRTLGYCGVVLPSIDEDSVFESFHEVESTNNFEDFWSLFQVSHDNARLTEASYNGEPDMRESVQLAILPGEYQTGPTAGRNQYSLGKHLGLDCSVVIKAYWHSVVEASMVRIGGYLETADVAMQWMPRCAALIVANPKQIVHSHGLRACCKPHTAQLYNTFVCKRALIVALKAELFRMIIMGKIVRAQTFDKTSVVRRQMNFWTGVWGGCIDFVVCVIGLANQMVTGLSYIMSSFVENEDAMAVIELMLMLFATWALWTSLRMVVKAVGALRGILERFLWPPCVLIQPEVVGESRVVARRVTSSGVMLEVLCEGKILMIPDLVDNLENLRTDEMALPGSTLCPSENRSVGAVLVGNASGVVVLGCFWRYNNWFVTARHVANGIDCSTAKVYLACVVKRGNVYYFSMADKVEYDKKFFEYDANSFDIESVDVFARRLELGEWTKIGVQKSATKKKSRYGAIVSSVGFNNELLVTASGKTLPKSGAVELYHTASTHKGFSGGPLYVGNDVVGMHVANENHYNVAVRIEMIKYRLDRYDESNTTASYDTRSNQSWKSHGTEVEFELFEIDEYAALNGRGEVEYGYNRDPRKPSREEEEDAMDAEAQKHKPKFNSYTQYDYDDRELESTSAVVREGVVELAKEYSVFSNGSPKEQPEAVEYLDSKVAMLDKLGYDPKKYALPIITPDTECESVLRHLQLYSEKVKSIRSEPTPVESNRVVRLMVKSLSVLAYEPEVGYKSKQKLIDIIHSGSVNTSKSAGHPYQSDGMPTIGDVLKKYTPEGLADLTLQEWNADFFLKVFLKAEPHKVEKLEKQMPRIITGMPVHKMVKNQAVFGAFRKVVVENYRNSPVKYCFSPIRPGDIKHLANCFGEKKVYSSDKHNWDFSAFWFIFSIVAAVIKGLARQSADMSDEEFADYLADVDNCVDEVNKKAKYRCTNGRVFTSLYDGIMKSGWLMTIDVNSLGQIAVDYLVKIRLGWTDEEILADTIVVGGDDVLQTFPDGVDLKRYIAEAAKLGFHLSEFEVSKFDGCEFFSCRYHKRNGAWTFEFVRWTKHIMNLRTNKLEVLPSALSSAMLNHVWNKKRYNFLELMYRDMRKKYPETFTLNFMKTRESLIYEVLGCE